MTLNYPLEQLLTIKKNRFDQALKILEEKKALLAQAEIQLATAQSARDRVREHKLTKLQQLREALDQGTSTDKIQQMKSYLKLVDQELAEKETKVAQEQKQVDLAQKQVNLATLEVQQKRKDLEKLELHKKEWSQEVRSWIERKEEVEHDEQGAALHALHNKEQKRRAQEKESS